MYRGYCAHSSLVGVCSSGVCLIIRTAITNAWQNCPCAQAATGDVDCSASVLTRPAARLSAQCHSRCSACRGLWSSALPIRLLGKAQFSLFHSSAVQTRLLRRAGAHIHRRCVPRARRAGARGRLCRDGGHARRAAQRGPCGGGPAALWARAGLLPAAGAAPAACIAETVQLSPHSAAPFTPSSFSATGGCR